MVRQRIRELDVSGLERAAAKGRPLKPNRQLLALLKNAGKASAADSAVLSLVLPRLQALCGEQLARLRAETLKAAGLAPLRRDGVQRLISEFKMEAAKLRPLGLSTSELDAAAQTLGQELLDRQLRDEQLALAQAEHRRMDRAVSTLVGHRKRELDGLHSRLEESGTPDPDGSRRVVLHGSFRVPGSPVLVKSKYRVGGGILDGGMTTSKISLLPDPNPTRSAAGMVRGFLRGILGGELSVII